MKTIISNKDLFLDKLKAKHDLSNYDFSDTVYISNKKPITFKCRAHGIITNNHPTNLLRQDYICKECKLDSLKTKWLDRASDIHGSKYQYDNVVYTGLLTPVQIDCNTHGEFWQTPETHLKSKIGCHKCALDADRLDTSKFIQRAKEVFGNKYDYSKSVYTLWSNPITITCPTHGDWETRAGSHLSGSHCLQCSVENSRGSREEFIKLAQEIHFDKYDYSNVDYVHSKHKVKIICPNHGVFKVKPNAHTVMKTGCPRCSESYGEQTIRNFFDTVGIYSEQEYRLPNYRYRMDFYLPNQNIFIEHHGGQHYHPINFFGGVVAFEEVKLRDKHKIQIARDMGIPLIVTNYKHLKAGKLIEQLICELKNIYLFWFITWDDEIVVFKHKSDLRKALNVTQRYTTDELVDIAESENDWVLLF